MILKEEKRNLFTVDNSYSFAHCISADYAMGAGIAVDFKKRFNISSYLHIYGDGKFPDCIYVDRVFNLVTKGRYWTKPTYETFRKSIEMMKKQAITKGITKIATYKLGCTRDKLQWGKVREIIQEIFEDTDIEILVCHI